MIIIDVKKVWQ